MVQMDCTFLEVPSATRETQVTILELRANIVRCDVGTIVDTGQGMSLRSGR